VHNIFRYIEQFRHVSPVWETNKRVDRRTYYDSKRLACVWRRALKVTNSIFSRHCQLPCSILNCTFLNKMISTSTFLRFNGILCVLCEYWIMVMAVLCFIDAVLDTNFYSNASNLHHYRLLDDRSVIFCSWRPRDYVTLGSLISQIRMSSIVCNVRAPYSGIETFGNMSSPFCTLAILWPPCKILRSSSNEEPLGRGVKRKRGITTYVTFGYLIFWWFFVYSSRLRFSAPFTQM